MELTPADGKLYALRDVTATIDCLPFICSSVVSKKVASGANIIILDVKYGQGAFIKTKEQAEELSKLMVLVGEKLGRKIICVITGMEQPLGCAVGNLLEVLESIDVLQGRGPKDVRDLTLYFGAVALVEARQAKDISEATKILEDLIHSGKAYQKFREMVISQGGDIESIEKDTFKQAKYQVEVPSGLSGYVQKCDALSIAKTCKFLGAGRSKKEDAINHKVGIVLGKKIGDEVLAGESLAVVYADDESFVQQAVEQIKQAYEIGVQKPIMEELIYKTVC
jgi:pyrimidine-nucleoside phosphorylase